MAGDESVRSFGAAVGAVADRLGVAPTAIAVGLLATIAAGIGGWWALRAPDPPPVESVIPSIADASIPVPAVATTSTVRVIVLVDVGGAVQNPGVHQLRPHDRIVDAIRAAGGLTTNADRRRLNMAMPIVDGQRIWVPAVGEDEPEVALPEGGSSTADSTSAGRPVERINLNQADSIALQTLPGIGPSIAASIVAFRGREGPFSRVEDLTKVPGIGSAKMQQIADLVTV